MHHRSKCAEFIKVVDIRIIHSRFLLSNQKDICFLLHGVFQRVGRKTQLLGVAFGLSPVSLGLQRNFVNAEPLPAMA